MLELDLSVVDLVKSVDNENRDFILDFLNGIHVHSEEYFR